MKCREEKKNSMEEELFRKLGLEKINSGAQLYLLCCYRMVLKQRNKKYRCTVNKCIL